MLSNSDLETLWHALVEHAEEPKLWGKDALSWQAFRACAASLPERFAALFDASVFLKLPLDRYGRVDVLMLFHLVMKRAVFEQHRITLAFYDVDGHGYLREAELENFITELIPSVPVLAALLPRRCANAPAAAGSERGYATALPVRRSSSSSPCRLSIDLIWLERRQAKHIATVLSSTYARSTYTCSTS